MKIAVVTDSSAGLTEDEAKKHHVYVVRMPLMIDGNEFLEEKEITREHFIVKMKNGALVKTAQPPLGHLVNLFDDLLNDYDHIIYLPISSGLSGSYQTAYSLAQNYQGKVHVVDTGFVSAPLGLLATWVSEWVFAGDDLETILNRLDEAYMWAALIPEDVTYLKRGGRIKPAAAAVANMMKIVPVLKVADGEIDLEAKVRTQKKAIKKSMDILLDKFNPEDYAWIVLDGAVDQNLYDFTVEEMEKRTGETVLKRPLFPIIMSHTGPGSISIAAVKKLK